MRSFSVIRFSDWEKQEATKIEKEIENQSKEYVLNIEEEEYLEYLIDKYSLHELDVDFSNEVICEHTKTKEKVFDAHYRSENEIDVNCFKVCYPFSGTSKIFEFIPSSLKLVSEEIDIDVKKSIVSIRIKTSNYNVDEFNRQKDQSRRNAFANIENANKDASKWNANLRHIITKGFRDRKSKYLEENNFFAAINVPVDSDTSTVFTVPTIKKKTIPQPQISKNLKYFSEPIMATETYDDTLKVIYEVGKSMERKPSLYIGKNEEDIRDVILMFLETRYNSASATGETFNRQGKTDIILKFQDGTNLFVAECKFWHGEAEFLAAISQLFDRYLTWRDSKTALILFVTNNDFTNVLDKIKVAIKSHQYFINENGVRGESSFSFVMRLPQDENKNVQLEIIAFHFDKANLPLKIRQKI